jgi:hypothetical protein
MRSVPFWIDSQPAKRFPRLERIVNVDVVGHESIECKFTRAPAYVHVPVGSSTKKEAASLKKEADLAAKLGFDTAYFF